jgi:MFS family permease
LTSQETGEALVRLDGRARALVAAAVAYTASAPGQSFLISLFVAGFLRHGGVSASAFSAMYAVATLCSAAWVTVLGRLAERFALRSLWLAVAAALAGGCFLASDARGALAVLVSLALLRMLGQGSLPLLGTVIANRRFGRGLGKAVAFSRSGHIVASIVLPPLVAALIVSVGWTSTYRIVGAGALVLLVPTSWCVDRRRQSVPAGAAPDGAGRSPAFRAGASRLSLPTRHATVLLATLAVAPLVTTAVSVQALSLLSRHGLGITGVAAALSVLGAAAAVATVTGGFLADRAGLGALLAASNAGVAIALALLLVTGPAVVLPAFAVLGAAAGLGGVVGGTVWLRTYGRAEIAKLQGMATGAQITGAALGPLGLALTSAATGSFAPGLVAMMLLGASAALAALWWSSKGRTVAATAAP